MDNLTMRSLGGNPEGARLERIKASPLWAGEQFRNLHPVMLGLRDPTAIDESARDVVDDLLRPIKVPAPQLPVSWTCMDSRWIVFLFDPERQVIPVAAILEQELWISAREAEVAAHLSTGKSLKLISQCLGVSDHSVRTHLKTIYAKTGLRSQAELVRRVVTGPAMHAKVAVTPEY